MRRVENSNQASPWSSWSFHAVNIVNDRQQKMTILQNLVSACKGKDEMELYWKSTPEQRDENQINGILFLQSDCTA